MSRTVLGEACGDDPGRLVHRGGAIWPTTWWRTGKGGRYITRDEVMEILKKAEDNGFVHQITNIDGENKIFAICNCKRETYAMRLRTSQLFNTPQSLAFRLRGAHRG